MVEMLHGFCKYKFAKMPNLVFGDKGKPYFCDEKDVHFSFSHSKNLAVCAISLPSVDEHALGTAIDFCDIGEEDDEGAQCVHSECVCVLHDEATECIGVDIQVSADSAPLSYNHEKIMKKSQGGFSVASR